MPSPTAGFARFCVALFAGMVIALQGVVASVAAQVSERAEPVTGPGVTTIGGIATNARTGSVEVTGWVNGRYLREG